MVARRLLDTLKKKETLEDIIPFIIQVSCALRLTHDIENAFTEMYVNRCNLYDFSGMPVR